MSTKPWPCPRRALVVGIDRYVPAETGGVRCLYPNLGGCVADAEGVATWLEARGMPRHAIDRMTQPLDGPSPDVAPTYEALVDAFERLRVETKRGDQVLVYFAGHGGRVPSIISSKVLDETLVPADVAQAGGRHRGRHGGRHLRDVELLILIERLIAAGAFLTVILDSCHSGGAGARSAGVRGVAEVDRTVRHTASRVAPQADLEVAWGRQRRAHRDLVPGSGWLPDPRGYVLAAACRANELAHEAYAGRQLGGVFTRALLESVAGEPNLTWDALIARAGQRVHAAYPQQTPVLEGERDRWLFGKAERRRRAAIRVVGLAPAGVVLDVGVLHGVQQGQRYRIATPDGTLVVIALERVGVATSVGRVLAPQQGSGLPGGTLPGNVRPADLVGGVAEPLAVAEGERVAVALDDDRRAFAPSKSPASSKLFEAALYPLDREPAIDGVPSDGVPCPSPGSGSRRLLVREGDWLLLDLVNVSALPLNVAVLNLRPSLAVVQVFPPPGLGPFLLLEADCRQSVPFRASLPAGLTGGTDVLRVVAALEPFDLRTLEMPPLLARTRSRAAGAHDPAWIDDFAEEGHELASPAFWRTVDLEVEFVADSVASTPSDP